jgi:hypothetical protein
LLLVVTSAALIRPSLPPLWLLQEIRDKYPPWLAAHEGGAGGVTPSDLARYKQQYTSICALVDMYESQPDNFQGILQHLQEVSGRAAMVLQTAGSTVHWDGSAYTTGEV